MYSRIAQSYLPDSSFFLFGPRQVGKSTLLKNIPSILTIDLLNPEDQLSFVKDPSLLSRMIHPLPEAGTVIIDEIQKAPRLLDVIHSLMEKRPQLRFVMSGSSARKLRRGAANLLGGRALFRALHPFTAAEMGDTFDLETVLGFGSLPKIWTTLMNGRRELARDLLRAYVITYIKEEVAAEALIRNLQGFQNFLDIAAAQFAEQVNLSGVARDCRVAYTTVREYYSILEDTLMGFFLRPYTRGVRKRLSLQPKFYFFDNGVIRALLGGLAADPTPIESGRLFEQWFVQEVYRLNEYKQKDWKLHFWRTSHGAEVDLLIESRGALVAAIECKHKKAPAKPDLSGLRSFSSSFPNVPCYLVAPLRNRERIDFVEALPPLLMLEILDSLPQIS